jgi:hypothetical protein
MHTKERGAFTEPNVPCKVTVEEPEMKDDSSINALDLGHQLFFPCFLISATDFFTN